MKRKQKLPRYVPNTTCLNAMNIFVCIYDYNDKYKNTYAPWRAARLYAAKI